MIVRNRNQKGSALLVSLMAVLVLTALAAGLAGYSGAVQKENRVEKDSTRAMYVAEAGLSMGINAVRTGAIADTDDQLDIFVIVKAGWSQRVAAHDVEHPHPVVSPQSLDEVRADKARTAGDQHMRVAQLKVCHGHGRAC